MFKRLVLVSLILFIPWRASAQPVTSLNPASASLSLNANNTAAPQTGTVYAIPQSCNTLSWIVSFATPPASVSTVLEFSNDNSVYEVADTSILVAGESRVVFTAARFVRTTESARSGGSSITTSLVCKNSPVASVVNPTTGNFVLSNGQFRGPNGTATAPTYSFSSNTGTSGLYLTGLNWGAAGGAVDTGISRTAAGNMSVGNGTAGDNSGTISAGKVTTLTGASEFTTAAAGFYDWFNRTTLTSPADGHFVISNNIVSIGSRIKVDALPTVASGFGTSPAITAGSTPFAGSINVGTGAPGTGGVINFNGTAFPSAPFVVCQDDSSLLLVRCTTTTTQLTIAATALTASDIVSWIIVSAK